MSQVTRQALAAILVKQASSTESSKQFSLATAAYLLKTHRTSELTSLMRDMMQLRIEQGNIEIMVVSEHRLSSRSRDDIKKLASKLFAGLKSVIISERIDPTLIGGVKLELANQQLDLSIRSKLDKFKHLTFAGKD